MRSKIDLGLDQQTKEERAVIAHSWLKMLEAEKVDIDDIEEAYILAIKAHKRDIRFFGVPDLLDGYALLSKQKATELAESYKASERTQRNFNYHGCPPEIKERIDYLFGVWDRNCAKKHDEPLEKPAPWKAPVALSSSCQACFGSGMRSIESTDRLTGIRISSAEPCPCVEGDKYRRSFKAALGAR